MRIAIVVTFAVSLVVAGAAEVAAQRMPSGVPEVDLGAPSNRGMVGRSTPWSGPPRANMGQRGGDGPGYFQPSERPFQGSMARRWQRKLNDVWGGIPADRNVPPQAFRGGAVGPGDPIWVHPRKYPIIECFGTRCQRVFPPIR